MESFTPPEAIVNNIEQENREKLEKETVFVQELLNTHLKLDEVHVGYGHPGRNQYQAFGVYRDSRIKWGSVSLGNPPPLFPETNILSKELKDIEVVKFDHELTHLVQLSNSDRVGSTDPLIKGILDEGMACVVELASQNQKTDNKIATNEVAAHCKRLTQENSDVFLNPTKIVSNEKGLLDMDDIRGIAIMKTRFYDGFNLKDRNMEYIAGISFVLNVLGDRIDKWTFLYDNPPTLEEVVNPDQYLARNGERLNNYSVNKVEPLHPKVTSRSQTI